MTRNFRVVLFTGIVAAILFSGVCTPSTSARPLFDQYVTLTKTGSPTTYSEVGDIIEYTYVVQAASTMPGEGTGIYGLKVSDDLADSINCPNTYLSAGESMICTGNYSITEADITAGEVTNYATISGSYEYDSGNACCGCGEDTRSISASNSFTVSYVPPLESELILEKTGSPTTFTEAGEEISYNYRVTNTGTVDLAGPVTVSDNKVDVSCPAGSLAVGATVECTASYTTTEEDVANGFVRNTATASANGTNSNEDSFEVRLDSNPELSLSKSTEVGGFTRAGDLMIYSFTLSNTGTVDLSAPFAINDPLIDEYRNCDFPRILLVGSNFSCLGYYRVRTGDVGNTLTNCASASGTYNRETISSDEACVDSYFIPPLPPPPPPPPLGPCDIDPNGDECYCEMYPEDCIEES